MTSSNDMRVARRERGLRYRRYAKIAVAAQLTGRLRGYPLPPEGEKDLLRRRRAGPL